MLGPGAGPCVGEDVEACEVGDVEGNDEGEKSTLEVGYLEVEDDWCEGVFEGDVVETGRVGGMEGVDNEGCGVGYLEGKDADGADDFRSGVSEGDVVEGEHVGIVEGIHVEERSVIEENVEGQAEEIENEGDNEGFCDGSGEGFTGVKYANINAEGESFVNKIMTKVMRAHMKKKRQLIRHSCKNEKSLL